MTDGLKEQTSKLQLQLGPSHLLHNELQISTLQLQLPSCYRMSCLLTQEEEQK